jgi:hypothetical protein
MTHSIIAVTTTAMNSFNEDIVKLATGQGKKGDFGHTFMQAGQGLLKTGLQGAEGSLLKAFHLGGATKADGSQANPYYVVMAQAGAAGAVPALGGIMSHIPGVGSGAIPNFLTSLLPHFAGGGDVLANHPALVGENGPEVFTPKSAGSITPNSSLGGTSHTYMIDARGSNDPAAIHAAVARALPHAVAASMQAQHQNAKRTPSGK